MTMRELSVGSPFRALILTATLATSMLLAQPVVDENAARRCANIFGDALKSGDTSMLRSILPTQGRVQVRLVRLATQDGAFSASQVQALMKDIFKDGSVHAFNVVKIEGSREGYAHVRASAELTDRNGVDATVDLHLALGPEDERWVLREIRESPR
jgi:hypothetical protein